MNKRKGKKIYSLWLDKKEGKAIMESLERGFIVDVVQVMNAAYNRGDFIKK